MCDNGFLILNSMKLLKMTVGTFFLQTQLLLLLLLLLLELLLLELLLMLLVLLLLFLLLFLLLLFLQWFRLMQLHYQLQQQLRRQQHVGLNQKKNCLE